MSKRDDLKAITHGWARRTLKTGRIAAHVAASGAKRVVRTSESDDAGFGASLADHLDEMKGFAMKVGQMLSYVDGVLPEATQEKLRALQAGSQPLAFDIIAPLLEERLGGPLHTLFSRFDETPIAAASIGQVHQAEHEGREVAVKVQYPNIAATFDTDFRQLNRLARLGSIGTSVDGRAIVHEIKARFVEECDYGREAAWQTAFRAPMAARGVHVPEVVAERSTDTVLTTEFVAATTFYDFVRDAPQAAQDRAGALLFDASLGAIFRHGAINADPHPGNYLFAANGDLTLLDWGCVRAYDADFVEVWRTMARAVLAKDRHAFEPAFRATGLVGREARFDWDVQWAQMQYLYEPMTEPDFRFDGAYVERSWAFTDPRRNPNLRHTAMPPPWVWTQRLHWGLYSVLARLNAKTDWRALYEGILGNPWQPVRIDTRP